MAVTSNDGGFPIVLELPAQSVKVRFREEEDVVRFFMKEVDLWRDLRANLPIVMASDVGTVGGMEAATQAYERLSGKGVEVLSVVSQYDKERPIVLQGALGGLLLDRGDETPLQTAGAIWATAAMLGSPRLNNVGVARVSISDYAAVTFGQNKLANRLQRFRSEKADIARLVGELQDAIASASDDSAATSSSLKESIEKLEVIRDTYGKEAIRMQEELRESVERLSGTATKEVSASVYEAKTNLAEHLRVSDEEIEQFKRKVRIDVGLEEPTNFWNTKADGHRGMAMVFGLLFLGAVAGMVYWIDGYAIDLVAEAVDRIVGDREGVALSLVPVAFVTIPALAFAWVLRHLSRIIIQNLSLEADARLRGTITRTFKALAADRAMNDAELAIALQALFRPIDGKDHSEIAPPSLSDILKWGGDNKPL